MYMVPSMQEVVRYMVPSMQEVVMYMVPSMHEAVRYMVPSMQEVPRYMVYGAGGFQGRVSRVSQGILSPSYCGRWSGPAYVNILIIKLKLLNVDT